MYRNVKNIVWIFSLISIVFAQRDFDEELKYKNESIETLKKEIVDLQKKLLLIRKRYLIKIHQENLRILLIKG